MYFLKKLPKMQKWLLWSLSFCILDADCLTTSWRHTRAAAGYSAPPSPASHRFAHARNLIVVLPVLHGYDNISQEKLQYLYTKPPVTVVVEDATAASQQATSLRARPNVVSEQQPPRTYETMRKPSSRRPSQPPSYANHLEPIDSDTRYLDFDTITSPDDHRAKADRREYEYPISSYEFVASTGRTPAVEYAKSTVDSNWKAIYVNYTDSSLSDSTEDDFDDEFTNSTEATDKIISILAQLGYLGSIDTSAAETTESTDSNYLTSFRTFAKNGDTKKPSSGNSNAHNLLQTLGLLGPKRPSADDSLLPARQKRQARDTAEQDASTTTESTRSRVLRYMMANPRIKSVHELFQVIRNTMNAQTSTRMGKSSKDDVPSTRQEFGGGADATSAANTTVAPGASDANETSSRATSLNDVDAPSPSEVASSTPPNGVYFYVDWNSFLNMTPSSGDPISVNFSPKAGNRRFFTPIEAFNRLAGAR